MKKFRTIMLVSMVCILFEGCPFGTAAFGTVTPTSYRPVSYAGDDSDTTFTFSFEIESTSDIRVWERTASTGGQTLKTETTHYSVSATNNDFSSGGTVTMVTAPATGVTLVIGREIPYDQKAGFIDAGVLRLASVENALDRLVLQVQQLEEKLNRAALNPETDLTTLDMTLPSSVDRASQFYGFSSSGEPTVISSGITPGDPTVTPYAETYLDDASEAAFKATTNIEAGTDFHGYTANGNTILTDAGLLSIAGLANAADKFLYLTGTDTFANADITTAGRAVLDDANAAAQLVTLGAVGADGGTAYTGTGSGFIDDDSMATTAATSAASSESIKAYVDAQVIVQGGVSTLNDSEANPMAKDLAYLTQTAGFVTVYNTVATNAILQGFVDTDTDPEDGGTVVAQSRTATTGAPSITFFIATGKYFELVQSAQSPTVVWTPIVLGGAAPIQSEP